MTIRRPQPLSLKRLRKKIVRALKVYGYRLGKKDGKEQLQGRGIITNDLLNVIQSLDAVVESQWHEKSNKYRYAFETDLFNVVMTFDRIGYVVFITAWRKTKDGRAPDVE